jgi:hypothetical protein
MVLVMCGRSDIGHMALIHSWRHIGQRRSASCARRIRLLATQGAWSSIDARAYRWRW